MDKNALKVFHDMYDCLNKGRLGRALRAVRSYVNANPYLMYDEGLDDIERDYGLMLDYMGRGYADEHRTEVYTKLTQRLYAFVSNLFLSYKIKNSYFFSDLSRRSINGSFSNERVKTTLENFVTDMAMLSLETDEVRETKTRELYSAHTRFMQQLFCYIVVSRQWSDAETRFYTETLVSPMIDTNDAQLIAGAISIAVIHNMDPGKFSALMNAYRQSTDMNVRQRALVGWVFALSSGVTCLPKVSELITEAMTDTDVMTDLAELQKQMVFCMNADRDNDTIRKDIMPELMKNNNLNITRFGITEKDETETDIFDPGATDRAMEKMEEGFRRMMNMQKAGSDIYFGGFSQMKRFPFFYNPANWFVPFFKQHPDIGSQGEKLSRSKFLDKLLNNGMFCDSDKYSFAIALSSIVDRLPDSMLEMLNSHEAFGPAISSEEYHSAAYIRRLVLQDMFRFFRLYPQREDFVNPFSDENCIFIINKLLDIKDKKQEEKVEESVLSAFETMQLDVASFMLKHKNKEGLGAILDAFKLKNNRRYLLLRGIYELDFNKNAHKAYEALMAVHAQEQDNRRVLSLLARASFGIGNYAQAAHFYGLLTKQMPDNKTTTLNHCIALAKAKRYDDAATRLYKMTFEDNSSTAVVRVLAWTLMGQGKFEQADKEYSKLLASADTETGDYLNVGYCRWFMNDIPNAVKYLRQFVNASNNVSNGNKPVDIEKEMLKDRDILTDHGINDVDFNLMVELLRHGDNNS